MRNQKHKFTNLILLLIVIFLFIGVAEVELPLILALTATTLISILILLALCKLIKPNNSANSLYKWTFRWTFAIFAMHLLLGSVVVSSRYITVLLGGDALTYSGDALAISKHWLVGLPMPALPPGKGAFFYILASIYYIFGYFPVAGMVINAAMFAATVPLLTDATRRYFDSAAAKYVPILLGIVPGFIIWGSQLIREPGVYLFLALSLWATVRLVLRPSIVYALVFAVAITILIPFRADVGILAGGGEIIGILFHFIIKQNKAGTGVITGVGILLITLGIVAGVGVGYGGYKLVKSTNLQQLNDIRMGSATEAASGFLPTSQITTPAAAVSYIPLGSTEIMIGPFPWQISVGTGHQFYALPDTFIWWYLLPSLWRGIKETRKRKSTTSLIFLCPALLVTSGLALIIANFGTAVRERMQVILILVPLIALGLSKRKQNKQRHQEDNHSLLKQV